MFLHVGPEAAEQVGERPSSVGCLGRDFDGRAGSCLVGECLRPAGDRRERLLWFFHALRAAQLLTVELLPLAVLLLLVDSEPRGGRGDFANVFGETGSQPVRGRLGVVGDIDNSTHGY